VIPFVGLTAQYVAIGADIDARIRDVVRSGQFINGPQVRELEAALEALTGAQHCVSCSSGTDGLVLALLALGVGPGHAVFVPAFTFAATAEAVVTVGAVPVFCDVDEGTFNLSAASLQAAGQRLSGLRAGAIIAVDMFGLPADYPSLREMARRWRVPIIADAAQSLGGSLDGAAVGAMADVTVTSFFPTKPLGCYGDGGAVFTDSPALADAMASLRAHGQGRHKYEHVRPGINARLDTLQAAVLLAKLPTFLDELEARRRAAAVYAELLGDAVVTPRVPPWATSAWAQYTIRSAARDAIAADCARAGVPTAIHYPTPLHRQAAFRRAPRAPDLSVAENLCRRVLSLPMHPYLEPQVQQHIAACVLRHVDN
jgi:dTDP-4-amino-4,6-dideoxygalactose transaminase